MTTACKTPSRVTVFIDYENVHRGALECFSSRLEEVRIYRGRPDPRRDARSATASDRQAAVWAQMDGVTAIRRPLRYPRGWPTIPAQEKGVDVAPAVDFVRLAMLGSYDVGIMVSSDTDLLPALEIVSTLTAAHAEVVAWRGHARLAFTDGRKLWCHWMNEDDYRTVEDLTNYTKPSGRRKR